MGLMDLITNFLGAESTKRQEEAMNQNQYMWYSTSAAGPGIFRDVMPDNEAILYDVYMVYAESLVSPVVEHVFVLAKNEDDAKIKSGLMKKVDEKWDTDYLSFLLRPIGRVAFKKKPSEVKIVT